MDVPAAVGYLTRELQPLAWVTDVFVGGSAATGDYRPRVSDLDLVALVDGPIDDDRRAVLVQVHNRLDAREAAGADLGCVYVSEPALLDPDARHPTWTHGGMMERPLSGIARAELVRHGFAAFGRRPQDVFRPVSDDDVRRAARAELAGYWAMAVRHPTWWFEPAFADLSLTSMARGRHSLSTGTLLTKTAAISASSAPEWLRADLLARRDGHVVRSPRIPTALIAWLDALRTTSAARRGTSVG